MLKLEEVLRNLRQLTDEELSKLDLYVSAELQERDLNGKRQAEGRGELRGYANPAPAAPSILAALREKAKAMSRPNTFALALEYERRTGKVATAELERRVLRPIVFAELHRRGEL